MKITYVAPIFELAGYSEFARNVVSGLVGVGADVKIHPLRINQGDGSVETEQFKALLGRHQKPDVNLVNTVPTLAQQFCHPGSFNVLYSMWEADKLPDAWIDSCNKFDLILTPSNHSSQVFADSVRVPVIRATPPINFSDLEGRVRPNRPMDSPFAFYSIFQWTERKNPSGLIRAYWAAFTGRDDVTLKLKLYIRDQNPRELERINAEISALKRAVRLRHYPKIELYGGSMTREQIIQFHLSGDCFVTASRGEGLGLGLLEAMALKTPCVATMTSGHLDFISGTTASQNCRAISTTKSPCVGMGDYAPWYSGDMYWDEADLHALSKAMVFTMNGSKPIGHLNGDCLDESLLENAAQAVRRIYDSNTCSKQLLALLEAQMKTS